MKRMTHDEYVERLKAIHDNIEVLEEFKNTQTSILHRCKIHNYEWMVLPNNLLRGKNCPKCSGVYRKTHNEYVKEVKSLRDNIEVLGTYKNNKTKILHRCKIHNFEWYISPTNLLGGCNCPKCSKQYRRSHDDYVAELKIKNPNLEVIGVYVDIDTKILHRCKTHDCVFEKFPSSALRGEGCVKCGHDKLASQFVKTHEQYVKELNDINSNIEVIGEYENSKTKILHRCKLDNYEWYATPDNILQSTIGCPMCTGHHHRSHEEYIQELKEINSNIEVMDKYINSQTKILHRCIVHDYKWYAYPNLLIRGAGCPKCGGNYNMTHEEYVEQVKYANINIEVLGNFKNVKTKIEHKCLIHDVVWNAYPESILRGAGCIRCGADKLSKIRSDTHDDYVEKLIQANSNVSVIEEYKGSTIKILHKCKKCNNIWMARPANILQGNGCPKCATSKGELEIQRWLEEHNIMFESQKKFNDCKDARPLPFDFYLCDNNICIEYDGEQHYKSVEYFGGEEAFALRQRHDKIKTEYCERNGIKLIRIAYNENVKEKLNLLFA